MPALRPACPPSRLPPIVLQVIIIILSMLLWVLWLVTSKEGTDAIADHTLHSVAKAIWVRVRARQHAVYSVAKTGPCAPYIPHVLAMHHTTPTYSLCTIHPPAYSPRPTILPACSLILTLTLTLSPPSSGAQLSSLLGDPVSLALSLSVQPPLLLTWQPRPAQMNTFS